jgi:hypothetical protein
MLNPTPFRRSMSHNSVIPAKAGISGQPGSALLHETPAFAGLTVNS